MISVCIATHNGERYIKEQINSILPQLDKNDEIIISDDGSTDNTLQIILSYNDPRIQILIFQQPDSSSFHKLDRQQLNTLYASRNFENALIHAKGDYIFLCDQDDVWYPEKVKNIMRCLETYDIVKHDFSTIDSLGNLIKESNYNAYCQRKRSLLYLIKYLPFRGCCIAFKRSILTMALPFPKRCLQHDSWIGMIARINDYSFCYYDKPLIYHRLHDKNVSELGNPNNLYYKIQYRLKLITQILGHQFKHKIFKHAINF